MTSKTSAAKEGQRMGILMVHRSGVDIAAKPPVLLLIAGFPDAASTWNTFASNFTSKYHVAAMAYPGMDPSEKYLEKERYWGYSTQEVVAALLALIQDYKKAGCEKIYLLGHDWGAFAVLSLAFQHPTAVTKVITEDIGLVDVTKHPILDSIKMACYQNFFVVLFIISRLIPKSDWLVALSVKLYPWKMFGPVPYETVSMAFPYQLYPYFQLMKGAVTTMKLFDIGFARGVPTLFFYGKKKGCMFHSDMYVEKLRTMPGCEVLEYVDAGHWIHVSHAKRMSDDVLLYLENEGD